MISRSSRAYARAASWSEAITRRAGVGHAAPYLGRAACPAARSTCRIQSPFGSSAARQAWESWSLVSGSPSVAAISSPARVRHRISPAYARKITGRTTPSASAGPYP